MKSKLLTIITVLVGCFWLITAPLVFAQNDKGLDPQQQFELEKEKLELKHKAEMAASQYAASNPADVAKLLDVMLPSNLALTIIVIANLMFFAAIVYIPFFFQNRKHIAKLKLCEKVIEGGKDIPVELFESQARVKRTDRHKGIILLSLGAGLFVTLCLSQAAMAFWSIGVIPSVLGLGYLLSHKFESRQ